MIASVALGLVWVFGAVALHAPGTPQLRADVQRSLILRSLNDVLPPSGPVLNALNRVDPAPSITGPAAPVGRPDPAIASDPDVIAAGRSVVRVLGTACGLGIEGSGWAVGPGLVVTNAHVIAGEDDTTVTTRDGASLDATPVHYDPENDLALLRVDADLPTLRFAPNPDSGTAGAILGYPENGPYSVAPARLGETREAISEDSYGRGPIHRLIVSLRGAVRSGNSGGPDRRFARARARHRFRCDDVRGGRWVRRSRRTRPCGSPRGRRGRRRHRALHELTPGRNFTLPVTYVQ